MSRFAMARIVLAGTIILLLTPSCPPEITAPPGKYMEGTLYHGESPTNLFDPAGGLNPLAEKLATDRPNQFDTGSNLLSQEGIRLVVVVSGDSVWLDVQNTGGDATLSQDINIAIENLEWDGMNIGLGPVDPLPPLVSDFVTNDSIHFLLEEGFVVPPGGLWVEYELYGDVSI